MNRAQKQQAYKQTVTRLAAMNAQRQSEQLALFPDDLRSYLQSQLLARQAVANIRHVLAQNPGYQRRFSPFVETDPNKAVTMPRYAVVQALQKHHGSYTLARIKRAIKKLIGQRQSKPGIKRFLIIKRR